MASSQKKVMVRLLSGDLLRGYLPGTGITADGAVDLLGVDGRRETLPLSGIKYIAYVREFGGGAPGDTEGLGRRAFLGRPRGEGLWLRLEFREGERIEVLAAFDLPALSVLSADGGIRATTPETRGNVLELFVPMEAILHLEVLGWIGRGKGRKPAPADAGPAQPLLFDR